MSFTKSLILTVVSSGTLITLFNLPAYRDWLSQKVMPAIKAIPEQLSDMEPEARKNIRWGTTYMACTNIKNVVISKHEEKSFLLLLPPPALVQNSQIQSFIVPEPIVFYLYTGLRSKWANSPGADSCNYALTVTGSNMELKSLTPELRTQILAEYRKYFVAP